MIVRRLALLISLLATFAPGGAQAAGFSASAMLGRTIHASCDLRKSTQPEGCFGEAGTAVATDARGDVIVAWADVDERLYAAVGDRRGHFGPAQALGEGLRPSVGLSADGRGLVAWANEHDQIQLARLRPGTTHFVAAGTLAPRASDGDDAPRIAEQPDGSAVVVYSGGEQARAVRVPASGTPQAFARIGHAPTDAESVGTSPDGTIVVCCATTGQGAKRVETLFVRDPRTGSWGSAVVPLSPRQDVESVAAGRGRGVLGTVDVTTSGDAGTLGLPGVLGVTAGPSFGSILPAPAKLARRAFGPVAGVDGPGRTVLVYQEKNAPSDFSRLAPVYAASAPAAATALGSRVTLTSKDADDPLLAPTPGGAVVAWTVTANRRSAAWGVAVERAGAWEHVAGPSGPGPGILSRDAVDNRAVASAAGTSPWRGKRPTARCARASAVLSDASDPPRYPAVRS